MGLASSYTNLPSKLAQCILSKYANPIDFMQYDLSSWSMSPTSDRRPKSQDPDAALDAEKWLS